MNLGRFRNSVREDADAGFGVSWAFEFARFNRPANIGQARANHGAGSICEEILFAGMTRP